jgi:MFS family permease
MTGESDYVKFIISRLLSGLFGSIPSAVGGSTIFDLFYLHQRGRAFICFWISITFGATVGPTLSGFIAGTTSWTWCFWWTVPLLAITALLVFLLAEDTSFDREQGIPVLERPPQNFLPSRVAIFFPGTAVVAHYSAVEVVWHFPFIY